MAKIGVCVEMVFTDLPYEERIRKVAALGYKAVEFWFHDHRFDGKGLVPEEKDFDSLAEVAKDTGVEISDFVLNAPDGSIGGSLVSPGDREGYLERLRAIAPLAAKIDCTRLITCTGNELDGVSREEQRASVVETLRAGGKAAAEFGITLLVEPLNTYVDHEGYFLYRSGEAAEIIREVALPNVRLLYDVYHMQIMEGNVLASIKKHLDVIGHFHSAGVPGRGELYSGELNYPGIISRIDELGYDGYFGLEYAPTTDHTESLRRTAEHLGVS